VLWRSPSSYEIRAAALAIGVLLATPYLYMYDLVVLAVPLAFLCRLGARGLVPLSEAIGRHAATMPSGRSADLIASACRFAFREFVNEPRAVAIGAIERGLKLGVSALARSSISLMTALRRSASS
jgi:hypothetical protein